MKKIFYILFLSYISSYSLVYGNETSVLGTAVEKQQAVQTLAEMNQNLSKLEQEKGELNQEWEFFRNTKGKLSDFIRTDLTLQERSKLQKILERYRLQETLGSRDETIRGSEEKREIFLQELSQYLESEKRDDFRLYITEGFSFERENEIIEEKIQTLKEKKEIRTDTLKMQIVDNSLARREEIQSQIQPLLTSKLDIFITRPNFTALDESKKREVFGNISKKIAKKRVELESLQGATSIVGDRITTFLIIEEVMESYIASWK